MENKDTMKKIESPKEEIPKGEADRHLPPSDTSTPHKYTSDSEKKGLIGVFEAISSLGFEDHDDSKPKEHLFWNTQPVAQSVLDLNGSGEIVSEETQRKSVKEVYALPQQFVWCELDVNDPDQLEDIYTILSNNYVEDEDSFFRFHYSKEIIKWALSAPGCRKEWCLGVRTKENGNLIAFISAIPITIEIEKVVKKMVAVDFLCIHKKLRSKRLSPLLIQEITRRVHQYGRIFHAIYTAGIKVPVPMSTTTYYHRPINCKKLVDIDFLTVENQTEVSRLCEFYEITTEPSGTDSLGKVILESLYPGLRKMERSDVGFITEFLNKYSVVFELRQIFSEREVEHMFLTIPGVVYSFVSDKQGYECFISFYEVTSHVIDNEKMAKSVKTAYLFYYAVKDLSNLKNLVNSMITISKELDFDVFNCLDIMDNHVFIQDLKFGVGDGKLHYHLFNWKSNHVQPKNIYLLLL